jgi:predicted GIY-YIG superfamily endonuclease
MWYVYILRSEGDPSRRYIGLTNGPDARLRKHNSGGSPHTRTGRPWFLDVSIGFTDRDRAAAFERYLKSGSGFAFAQRHF